MKRLKRQAAPLLSGIAALCLLAACALEPPPEAPAAAAGKTGRVLISITGARTLLPIYESLVYDYEFTASGKEPVSGSFEEGTAGSADLEAGTWDLTVTGKRDGTEVLTGSLSGIEINFEETRSVNVAMTRVPQTGNGALSYTVSFPGTVSTGYLRVFNLSGTLAQQVNLFNGAVSDNGDGTKTANGSLALAEAYYRVGFHLSTPNAVLNRTVLVHVYTALTTPVSYAFTDADFFPADVDFPQTSLAEALAAINTVVLSEGVSSIQYDLPFDDETMVPTTVSRTGSPITVIINGNGRTVTLTDTGSLISLGNNVTLVLKNITLTGRGIESGDPLNSAALVTVAAGGKLELGIGALVTGNKNSSNGGGVYVASGGTFAMSGGEISGNTVSGSGGGVFVDSGGAFAKQGGTIYGANASGAFKNTAPGYSYGHAVYVSTYKRRNLTVGAENSLDTAKSGAEGGWAEPLSANPSLDESLAWHSAYAVEGGEYTITLSGNESSAPRIIFYDGKTVAITLSGGAAVRRTVSLTASGPLFTVGDGVTLKLGNNITLQGLSGNTSALVQVESGGKLEMDSGSKISGNTNTSASNILSAHFSCGGVFVSSGSAFAMSGGEISGNEGDTGGGVAVYYGTFTMSGGTISGNTARWNCGGVYVTNYSTFTMNNGTIRDNTSLNSIGGVRVTDYSTFTLSGGTISGNTAHYQYCGGVAVSVGTFVMEGGEISGNTVGFSGYCYGGGVEVGFRGTFDMRGGTIWGNTAGNGYGYGGGVWVYIDDDDSEYDGTFTKQPGGVIYGANETGTGSNGEDLKNTALTSGSAVYFSSSKYRNTTVGAGEELSTGSDANWND
jgi:hypothetical protein